MALKPIKYPKTMAKNVGGQSAMVAPSVRNKVRANHSNKPKVEIVDSY
jgi:hypothetical protein